MKFDKAYARTMRIDLLLEESKRKPTPLPHSSGPIIRKQADNPGSASDFDILLQSIYDAVLLTRYNGIIQNVNDRALHYFGRPAAEIIGRHISEFIPGVDADILGTIVSNVESSRYTLLQAYCIRQDESLFPAEISATCLDRASAHDLCFFIRDISLRRQVEEQLRITHNAVQNAASAIAITTDDGAIIYTNPAITLLWQMDGPDAPLPFPRIQDYFHDPAAIDAAIDAAMTHRTWNGELEAHREAMSDPFYVHTAISSCVDENNTITHLVFSFIDTTKRRLDEEALRQYRDHLEELIAERTANLESTNNELKNEIADRLRAEKELHEAISKLREHDVAKSLFVSNVSHELRTPLTALIHAAESLLRGVAGPVPAGVASYLTMMLEDGWRLERTVCDILDLSRIESGTLALNKQRIPFVPLVMDAVEALRKEVEGAGLTLHIDAPHGFGFVECDAAKIERVVINILNNAAKFTPAGGTITLRIRALQQGGVDGIGCFFTDTGIGIPEQYLSRVTERFFRVGEQVGGTGLGLAITKEIVDRHHGVLAISSPPPGAPQGTEVLAWLPTVPPPEILIACGNPERCRSLSCPLSERGYRLTCSPTGNMALQQLRDGHHQLAIIHGPLPDIDAIEMVMHVKADSQLRHLPVFFLAESTPSSNESSILAGFSVPVFMWDAQPDLFFDAIDRAFMPPRSRHRHEQTQEERDNA